MTYKGVYFNFKDNEWGFLILDNKKNLEITHDKIYDLFYPFEEIKRLEGKCNGGLCYRIIHLNPKKNVGDFLLKEIHRCVIRDTGFYFWDNKENLEKRMNKRLIRENLL